METITITAARVAFPEMLKWVSDGEEVTITKHGRPVAVVVRPDLLVARRAADAAG